MSRFVVNNVDSNGPCRRVQLKAEDGSNIYINVHRFAQVGKDDVLEIDPIHSSKMWVISSEDDADRIQITPHYEKTQTIKIGSTEFQIKLTEITTQADLDDYLFLESFHYKSSSSSLNSDDEQIEATVSAGGRRAVIMCYLRDGLRMQAVGYIELQMPLLMVKPRHELFASPFNHSRRPISWEKWDQHAIKKHVNTIVRIARVVVAPEFRGLGLAKILIKHAKDYSQTRWQLKGRRPLFVEISAEMLRYVDFVSSNDIRYVGDTEGNQARVHKDLTYMQRNYSITSGIMSLQRKYLNKLIKGAELLNKDLKSIVEKLGEVAKDLTQLRALPPAEYYLFRSVLRLPIPYHLGGLDDEAEKYIANVINEKHIQKPEQVSLRIKPSHVNIKSLSITSRYSVPQTASVRTIMDCFGLEGEEISRRLFSDLDIEASAGNIIFISGVSGSGKSLLLKAIDPSFASPNVQISKKILGGESEYTVGWLRPLPNDIPLIEYFSEKWGIEKALKVLNQVGLAEAFVYIKPYDLLSRGQRYRARLAELIIRDDQVWLIDEFCADLDPLTAKIVAHSLRKLIIHQQRIAFIAAANHSHFLDALRPTRVISLRAGTKPKITSFREYWDEFYNAAS